MFTYIASAFWRPFPVMVVVALFVFQPVFIGPGDPATVIAGDQATPGRCRAHSAESWARPAVFCAVLDWAWRLLHADLGRSIFTNLPVTTMIAQRVEPTSSLMLITLILSVVVAVADRRLGGVEGRNLDRPRHHGVRGVRFSVRYSWSVICWPSIFCVAVEWLPVQGYTPIAQGVWPWLQI